jgi:hypothetical protein
MFDEKIFDDGGSKTESGLGRQFRLNCLPIEATIDLRPRSANGGALRPVEQPKLNAGCVRHAAHQAVERIDFPD